MYLIIPVTALNQPRTGVDSPQKNSDSAASQNGAFKASSCHALLGGASLAANRAGGLDQRREAAALRSGACRRRILIPRRPRRPRGVSRGSCSVSLEHSRLDGEECHLN